MGRSAELASEKVTVPVAVSGALLPVVPASSVKAPFVAAIVAKSTLPVNTLLRWLALAPSSAWMENVGAASLPSCTKRTWFAARSADVNVVALVQ